MKNRRDKPPVVHRLHYPRKKLAQAIHWILWGGRA